ncbi:MAG: heme exporter protein CcmD [Gammaproteobacteria bacterium]|nr:heme exporter protein CcmD [Gammaproteobacteria bacterium]
MALQEFLAMGKHGFYVWWSYGLTVLTIIVLFMAFAWYKKQLINKVKSLSKQQAPKARTVKTEQVKTEQVSD